MRWLICCNVNINVNNKPKSEVVLVLRFNLLLRFHEAGADRHTDTQILYLAVFESRDRFLELRAQVTPKY